MELVLAATRFSAQIADASHTVPRAATPARGRLTVSPDRVSAGGPAGFQSGQPSCWPTPACRDYNRHFVVVDAMAKRARPTMASSQVPDLAGEDLRGKAILAQMDGTSRMSPAEGRESVMVIQMARKAVNTTRSWWGSRFQGESAGCRSPFSPDGTARSLRARAGGFVVCRRGWAARQAVQRYA